MKPSKPSTTAVCALHYAKLLIRLAIFITLLVLYVAAQPLCEADLRPNLMVGVLKATVLSP